MKLSPSTKILIVLLLLVAAVGAWYTLYMQNTAETAPAIPQQKAEQPPENAKAVTSTSARALEILPLPFLVTKAPEEAPPPPPAAQKPVAEAKTLANTPPPNPFKPLPKRLQASKASQPKPPPKPKPTPKTSKPVAIDVPAAPEMVRVPIPQIQPPPKSEPVLPPEAEVGRGVLPVRMKPLEEVVAPREETPPQKTSYVEKPAPAQNPIEAWIKSQGIKLAGVTLGPVSVAMFNTKDGYVAVPVGERFPGTDILVKSVTAEGVVLVQGSYSLTLRYEGGE